MKARKALCLLGHRPTLDQQTKGRVVSATMKCTRCKSVLGMQISVLMRDQ